MCRPLISTAFGGLNKRRGAYSRKYGTKRYYYVFKRRIFGEKFDKLRSGAPASVHFLMHCVT